MTTKTTKHFYRWRGAAKLKFKNFFPSFSTGKNVQGASFNRFYSINWFSWSYTIWKTIYDYQTGETGMDLHELNVQKYLQHG